MMVLFYLAEPLFIPAELCSHWLLPVAPFLDFKSLWYRELSSYPFCYAKSVWKLFFPWKAAYAYHICCCCYLFIFDPLLSSWKYDLWELTPPNSFLLEIRTEYKSRKKGEETGGNQFLLSWAAQSWVTRTEIRSWLFKNASNSHFELSLVLQTVLSGQDLSTSCLLLPFLVLPGLVGGKENIYSRVMLEGCRCPSGLWMTRRDKIMKRKKQVPESKPSWGQAKADPSDKWGNKERP